MKRLHVLCGLVALFFISTFIQGPLLQGAFATILEGETYYLACNLHADPRNDKISSVNYQIPGGMISWGTKVKILDISKKKVVFEDVEIGRKYKYEIHKRTRKVTSLDEHLGHIFTKDIKALKRKVGSLSKIDRRGIEDGKVYNGMTKEGVLIAIGYPPEFANPKPMQAKRWTYWYNRWAQFFVKFDDNGRVIQVVGHYD